MKKNYSSNPYINLHIYKTPSVLRWFYPELIWRMPAQNKTIYLTFDDGPVPEVTEFVLNTLQKFNAKATFFCVGENIKRNPDFFQKIIQQKHSIGNHTFNHLNGWKTDNESYFKNIAYFEENLRSLPYKNIETRLFRPPYGKIKKSQIRQLKGQYRIIMWDVLTHDFVENADPEISLRKSIQRTQPGSIVIFHDSKKAENNMRYILPSFLQYFSEKGYQFLPL